MPNDVYSIYGSVSQVTNECGRVILAETTVTLGGGTTGAVLDELSITLRTPGAEIGSNFSISNPYPQLSWEGDASVNYRVIVVSGDADQDVQTMINDSKGSPSDGPPITPYEYLDREVTGTIFNILRQMLRLLLQVELIIGRYLQKWGPLPELKNMFQISGRLL